MAVAKFQDREAYLKFRRPDNNCLLCAKPIHAGGQHPSMLRLSVTEEVIRNDFCAECWGKVEDREYFSFWVTKRIAAPTAEERRLLKSERNEALYRLFAALYDSETQDVAAQMFFLAHLLMRYKVLVYKGVAEDGRLHFEHPKLQIAFFVEDMPINAADFVKIQESVEEQAIAFAPSNQPVCDDEDATGDDIPAETPASSAAHD